MCIANFRTTTKKRNIIDTVKEDKMKQYKMFDQNQKSWEESRNKKKQIVNII